MLGIGLHSIGAFLSANCYAPQKGLRGWSWESFWITQAAWCWFLWPIIGAFVTIPHLGAVLAEAPKMPMLLSFLLGIAYGVGGTAFNLSIRHIGFSLTYSIAIGISCVLGTIVPPIARGQVGEIVSRPGSLFVILGVTVGALGIALCGVSGRFKERDLQGGDEKGRGEFNLWKGLLLSTIAGVLSSVYNFSLEAADPIAKVAGDYGAGHWKDNVKFLFSNTGAFVTAAAYALYLARRNSSLRELVELPDGRPRRQLISNYALAFLTGTLWYGQFFFYNLGHFRLGGAYEFSSWAIHMILLVLFSNILGVLFREWRGCRPRTKLAIAASLVVLIAGFLLLAYGNHLGKPLTE